MNKCQKMASIYLAMLRSIYNIHQNNHWLTKGNDFYGNHLLFKRMYESAQENADLAAEKFIGILGRGSLTHSSQSELISKITKKYGEKYSDLLEMSLEIELEFLKFSDEAYNCFEQEGNLTLGLDDMLCAIANKREESIYLLRSALSIEP
jgi:DNA-binding ferritin-like protein